MAQTFDIRFARSAGLAGLFEAPANEYRWKGVGRLSIDASGISIAERRGLSTLFARAQSRHIAATSLIEVHREGNALRLEFSTPESPRAVLPFWVSDRNAAAEIVTLLPTQRSVELEDDTGSTRGYRFDRRFAILLVLGIVTLGVGVVTLQRYLADQRIAAGVGSVVQPFVQGVTPGSPDATSGAPALEASSQVAPGTPASAAPVVRAADEIPVPVYIDPPELPELSVDRPAAATAASAAAESVPAPAVEPTPTIETSRPTRLASPSFHGIVPIVPGDPRYAIARREFDLFQLESSAPYVQWLSVTARIHNTADFAGIEFLGLREMELAISRAWRDQASMHGEAARAHREFIAGLEELLPQFVN